MKQDVDGTVIYELKPTKRVTIPFKNLISDPKFNARRQAREAPEEYQKGIESLAASIHKEGLLQPPEARQLENRPGYYSIVFGFRRYDALALLGVKEIEIQVFEGPESEAYVDNLVENEQREPLLPHELAERCCFLRDTFGLEGSAIAKRIRRSKGHVNNLMRIKDKLDPAIYAEAFAAQVPTGLDGVTMPRVSLPVLQTIAGEADKKKQREMLDQHYRNLKGEEAPATEGAANGAEHPTVAKRLSPRKAEAFYDALKKDREQSDEWRAGAIATAKYLLGLRATAPIKMPEEPKKEKAENGSKPKATN